MSFDLVVFRKDATLPTRSDFESWYATQSQWSETHNYDDPVMSHQSLKSWFMEMIETFPAKVGPYAFSNPTGDYVTNYTIGRDLIYASFQTVKAQEAYKKSLLLAEKYQLGFFDVMVKNGDIMFPDENGKLKKIDNPGSINSIELVNNPQFHPPSFEDPVVPLKRPVSVIIAMILLCLKLLASISLILMYAVVSKMDPGDNAVLRGVKQGFDKTFGGEGSDTAYALGYLAGTLFIPVILTISDLICVYNRKFVGSIVLTSVLIVVDCAGGIPFIPVIVLILLLIAPSRKYLQQKINKNV